MCKSGGHQHPALCTKLARTKVYSETLDAQLGTAPVPALIVVPENPATTDQILTIKCCDVPKTIYLILLSVRMRIHCGTCLFCLAFFAKVLFVLKVLWDACTIWNQLQTYSSVAKLQRIKCLNYFNRVI
jgi:hypothetical protein